MNSEHVTESVMPSGYKKELEDFEIGFRESTPYADKVFDEVHKILKSKCYTQKMHGNEIRGILNKYDINLSVYYAESCLNNLIIYRYSNDVSEEEKKNFLDKLEEVESKKQKFNLRSLFLDKITADNIDTVNKNIDYLIDKYGTNVGNEYSLSWFLNIQTLATENNLELFANMIHTIIESTNCTPYSASLKIKISRDICDDIDDWYFYCKAIEYPNTFSPEVINKLWNHFKQFVYNEDGLLDLPRELFSGSYNDSNYKSIIFDNKYKDIMVWLVSGMHTFKHRLDDKYSLEQIKAVFDNNANNNEEIRYLTNRSNTSIEDRIVEWLRHQLEGKHEEPQAGTTSFFNH